MFLDIAIGILLSIWASWFFQTNLTLLFVLSGIVFALLPDIDFVVEYAKHGSVGGKVIREHRELTHFPVLYIFPILIIWAAYGSLWASLFGLAIFSHFLHDSIYLGWGIKWLWPFSRKAYKLFSDKNGKPSSRFVVSWNHEELTEVVAAHGDPDWVKNIYLRLHPLSLIELSAFVFALAALYFYW